MSKFLKTSLAPLLSYTYGKTRKGVLDGQVDVVRLFASLTVGAMTVVSKVDADI